MRPQHWAKSFLVFVPLLTAHAYTSIDAVTHACIGFACFCLCASGGYFINDLWDLEADRNHTIKRHRPLASGTLPVGAGLVGAVGLPLAAFGSGGDIPHTRFHRGPGALFRADDALFILPKRVVTADVLTLSILYMLRVLAGAVAIQVYLSSWLLGFWISCSSALPI